ncbi:hypothetical protein H2198_000663 [Neophaeococcomyces mojaviensis]|uniref:Uncharacterized protein n=1 Tax=Neophaeococcomyces mojaviensis TaxID=3383035 RepID=A0ACC3AJ16_9EURO|nr:hypothetical protein H2198_000663 [Knufia sp. JES_112]
MTTWVLPIIALLSQLPYESTSKAQNREAESSSETKLPYEPPLKTQLPYEPPSKNQNPEDKPPPKFQNLEAFVNWMGSPATALTSTIWNVLMIRKCQILSITDPVRRDSLYILSCINQYQYPRSSEEYHSYNRRDIALLRGVLYPFVSSYDKSLSDTLRTKLENLTDHLTFQLRLQRRKGVHALWLNLIWFLLAFVFSLVTAFADLHDNTTPHSLALGLLLSWMPTVVLATLIDRNPASATRCRVLIERWLYNVDALFAEDAMCRSSQGNGELTDSRPLSRSLSMLPKYTNEDNDSFCNGRSMPQDSCRIRRRDTEQQDSLMPDPINTTQWQRDIGTPKEFDIGDFVGQGRRMRYCGVASTILQMISHPNKARMHLPGKKEANKFQEDLPNPPLNWYWVWLVSQLIVGTSYASAFGISFYNPTIGLGCRTFAYTVWYILSFSSWLLLGICKEPQPFVRVFACIPNALASLSLFIIMFLQTIGGLNNCVCKSSTFGTSSYGGYMDFMNTEFNHDAYALRKIWGIATAFGLTGSVCPIVWFWIRWRRDSHLWAFDEKHRPGVLDGVDLQWLI